MPCQWWHVLYFLSMWSNELALFDAPWAYYGPLSRGSHVVWNNRFTRRSLAFKRFTYLNKEFYSHRNKHDALWSRSIRNLLWLTSQFKFKTWPISVSCIEFTGQNQTNAISALRCLFTVSSTSKRMHISFYETQAYVAIEKILVFTACHQLHYWIHFLLRKTLRVNLG